MAPGAFSILAPLLGRKSKKYEKLETEEQPADKKRQEATQEEINRLNCKIVSRSFNISILGNQSRQTF